MSWSRKENVYFAYYVDVTSVKPEDVTSYMQVIKDNITKNKQKHERYFFIPVKGQHSVIVRL